MSKLIEPKFDLYAWKHNEFNPGNGIKETKGISEHIEEYWAEDFIKVRPPHELPLVMVHGTPIATPANHTLVKGKKKARKTLTLVYILAKYAGSIADDILWFDTEQGKQHVYDVRDKIKQLTGQDLNICTIRKYSAEEKRDYIKATVEKWPTRPKIVVIDGIRDLIKDFNSIEESSIVVTWLENLITTHDIHSFNVLHENKNPLDKNPRGHLGTELANKCQTEISVEKDKDQSCSIVSADSSRDQAFTPFRLKHDANGLPELVAVENIKGSPEEEADMKDRIRFVFEDAKELKFGQVIKGIMGHFEKCGSQSTAYRLLCQLRRKNWIEKFGEDRSQETVYKLILKSE
jgi:hypothetical protein